MACGHVKKGNCKSCRIKALPKKQNGGWLDSYEDGGQLPSYRDGKGDKPSWLQALPTSASIGSEDKNAPMVHENLATSLEETEAIQQAIYDRNLRANTPGTAEWSERASGRLEESPIQPWDLVGAGLLTATGKAAAKAFGKKAAKETAEEVVEKAVTKRPTYLQELETNIKPELIPYQKTKAIPKTQEDIILDSFRATPSPDRRLIKSEIDWGKWNKEIPENKKLMDEYLDIETKAKADGTWMKNSDGSKFEGTPEQFVQQNSENFKKAMGNNYQKSYRGQNKPLENVGEGIYGNRLFVGNKEQAKSYIRKKGNTGEVFNPATSNPLEGALHELVYPKSNKTTIIDAKGKAWNKLKEPEIKAQLDDFRGYVKKGTNYTGKPISDDWVSPYINTDDIADYVGFKGLDYGDIKNVSDYGTEAPKKLGILNSKNPLSTTRILNTKEGNYPKSLWYNNGMFDMTNPNIYKALTGVMAGGTAAAAAQEKKNGGWLDEL